MQTTLYLSVWEIPGVLPGGWGAWWSVLGLLGAGGPGWVCWGAGLGLLGAGAMLGLLDAGGPADAGPQDSIR